MPRYLIIASHEPNHADCVAALDAFLQAGAHYLTHADWGCKEGIHRAWIVVEAENDAEAKLAVPPVIRDHARPIRLCRFEPDEIRALKDAMEKG